MTLAGKISVNTSYIAIDACPGDEEGMSSCFSESSLNIKDFLFVSGKSQLGTVIFRNRKYATCNNATDIREWNLETGYCPEVAETSNIAELIELLLYNCTLASVPSASDRDYLDMYRCFNHDVIATCNNASSQLVSPEVKFVLQCSGIIFSSTSTVHTVNITVFCVTIHTQYHPRLANFKTIKRILARLFLLLLIFLYLTILARQHWKANVRQPRSLIHI